MAALCGGATPAHLAASVDTCARRRRRRCLGGVRGCCARQPVVLASSCAPRPLDDTRTCTLYDMHTHQVPYQQAWDWQRELVARRLSALDAGAPAADRLLVLQHPPVYTLGTASSERHLRFDPAAPPEPLYRTERGGEATFHGPGQLVLYPVLDLRGHCADLHWYMRALEEVCIRALAEFGLPGERVAGLTGTWCAGRKVAAQGVRARRWVTYHGLALNVTTDLSYFDAIVPCGIPDRPVGSVKEALRAAGEAVPPDAQLLDDAYRALLVAFEDVFDVRLEPPAAGDEFAAQCAPFLIPPACDVLLADGAVAGR